MKNAKYLVLALVASMILMGAGYAWWNDTVTVTGTLSTGTFNVEIIDTTSDVTNTDNDGVSTISDTHGTNTATFTILKAYPGATYEGTVKFENKGTLPAKLESIPTGLNAYGVAMTLDMKGYNVNTLLQPGGVVEFGFTLAIDELSQIPQGRTFTHTVTSNWIQHNK